MKSYKVSLSVKLFVIIFSAIVVIPSSILAMVDNNASLFFKLIAPMGIIIAIGGSYMLYKIKITVDDEKIGFFNVDIFSILLGKSINQVILYLNWSEIEELDTHYVLYPESPIIVLKPKTWISKKKIEFIMFGIPIELLIDILSHLPKETKINLYTYLKRKLEGKQTLFFMRQEWHDMDVNHIKIKPRIYTKQQLITIAILLTLMIIGGFLFSWFIWK